MEIDLGNISEKLIEKFPQIEKIHLFGSRRYGTNSTRSDIDLLIEFSAHVKQKDILEFCDDLCPALDIFKLENGKAISFQNDSFIQFQNKSELLQNLNAVEIWNNKEGRLKADIKWSVEIDPRASYPPTSLPNRDTSEAEILNYNPSEITICQLVKLFGNLKTGQLSSLIVALFLIGGSIITWGNRHQANTNAVITNQASNTDLSSNGVYGEINLPRNGELVSREISISGETSELPSEKYRWILIYGIDESRWYPRKINGNSREFNDDSVILGSQEVEFGTGFIISLFITDKNGDNILRQIAISEDSIESLPDGEKVDEVVVFRKVNESK